MTTIHVSVTMNNRTKERAVYPESNTVGLANLLAILVKQKYQMIIVSKLKG